jgi:hypothetical protein
MAWTLTGDLGSTRRPGGFLRSERCGTLELAAVGRCRPGLAAFGSPGAVRLVAAGTGR